MSTSEAIMRELRAAKPAAPDTLRERVRGLQLPPPRPLRRFVLVAAPVIVAVGLGVAVVVGVVDSGDRPVAQRAEPALRDVPKAVEKTPGTNQGVLRSATTGLAPSTTRLQQYDVSMQIRVRNLGDLDKATKKAMSLTRRYGGYVAAVDYSTGRRGDAKLVLRVPVDRVQDAIQQFSALGSILGQNISVKDVQQRVNDQTKAIGQLKNEIQRIQARLRNPNLSPAEREQLEYQLSFDRQRLSALQRDRSSTVRRAQLARISLTLTTHKAAAAPADKSRLDRAVGDAVSVLAAEVAILLYVLLVAGPLLVLLIGGVLLARAQRRRLEERLLERAT
jgi:Domain of unknown function (DUF4349)